MAELIGKLTVSPDVSNEIAHILLNAKMCHPKLIVKKWRK